MSLIIKPFSLVSVLFLFLNLKFFKSILSVSNLSLRDLTCLLGKDLPVFLCLVFNSSSLSDFIRISSEGISRPVLSSRPFVNNIGSSIRSGFSSSVRVIWSISAWVSAFFCSSIAISASLSNSRSNWVPFARCRLEGWVSSISGSGIAVRISPVPSKSNASCGSRHDSSSASNSSACLIACLATGTDTPPTIVPTNPPPIPPAAKASIVFLVRSASSISLSETRAGEVSSTIVCKASVVPSYPIPLTPWVTALLTASLTILSDNLVCSLIAWIVVSLPSFLDRLLSKATKPNLSKAPTTVPAPSPIFWAASSDAPCFKASS